MTLLLLLSAAFAYDYKHSAIQPDDLPMEFCIYPAGLLETGAPIWPTNYLDLPTAMAVTRGAMASWSAGTCTGVQFVEVAPPCGLMVVLGDYGSQLPPGIPGITLPTYGEPFTRGERTLTSITGGTILVNDQFTWLANTDPPEGECYPNLDTFIAQQVGGLLGLDQPCDPCDEPPMSVMPQTAICAAPRMDDDIAAVEALYGPQTFIACSHEVGPGRSETSACAGADCNDIAIKCTAVNPELEDNVSLTWDWGDGKTTDGTMQESHSYTEGGVYTVEVCATGDVGSDTCATNCATHQVDVCPIPEPSFDLKPVGVLGYQVDNTTVTTPGCITNFEWQLTKKGEKGKLWSDSLAWEPFVRVPDTGDYTVTLTVATRQQTYSAESSVTATGCNCTTSPASAGWMALMLPALWMRRR